MGYWEDERKKTQRAYQPDKRAAQSGPDYKKGLDFLKRNFTEMKQNIAKSKEMGSAWKSPSMFNARFPNTATAVGPSPEVYPNTATAAGFDAHPDRGRMTDKVPKATRTKGNNKTDTANVTRNISPDSRLQKKGQTAPDMGNRPFSYTPSDTETQKLWETNPEAGLVNIIRGGESSFRNLRDPNPSREYAGYDDAVNRQNAYSYRFSGPGERAQPGWMSPQQEWMAQQRAVEKAQIGANATLGAAKIRGQYGVQEAQIRALQQTQDPMERMAKEADIIEKRMKIADPFGELPPDQAAAKANEIRANIWMEAGEAEPFTLNGKEVLRLKEDGSFIDPKTWQPVYMNNQQSSTMPQNYPAANAPQSEISQPAVAQNSPNLNWNVGRNDREDLRSVRRFDSWFNRAVS